jgi:replication initiation protein RepC
MKGQGMDQHQSTTPFGRRPLSLAMVAARAVSEAGPKDALAEKWKVFDNLRGAKTALGISDRALSVLNALLTFHQDTTLQLGSNLIVYPSNKSLTFRANGMSPATLRRHLAALVQAGLVIRRDSPNGKRYARKGKGGCDRAGLWF